MKIAAFDLGSTIGTAQNIADPLGMSGHWELEGTRPARLARLIAVLEGFFAAYPEIDVVAYERPFARGQHATRALWGYAGVLEAMATQAGCAVVDVTPAEIKKFASASGKADKQAMIAAAQLMGYSGDNEHEADAWCLLRYAEAKCIRETRKVAAVQSHLPRKERTDAGGKGTRKARASRRKPQAAV